MLGYRGPAQPSPTLGDALNPGYLYLYLEVRCLGCDTHQTVALDIVRRAKSTPIHELERYMRCTDCSEVRGYPYKRSYLVALRTTKISASAPPSTWWPGEQCNGGRAGSLAEDVTPFTPPPTFAVDNSHSHGCVCGSPIGPVPTENNHDRGWPNVTANKTKPIGFGLGSRENNITPSNGVMPIASKVNPAQNNLLSGERSRRQG